MWPVLIIQWQLEWGGSGASASSVTWSGSRRGWRRYFSMTTAITAAAATRHTLPPSTLSTGEIQNPTRYQYKIRFVGANSEEKLKIENKYFSLRHLWTSLRTDWFTYLKKIEIKIHDQQMLPRARPLLRQSSGRSVFSVLFRSVFHFLHVVNFSWIDWMRYDLIVNTPSAI